VALALDASVVAGDLENSSELDAHLKYVGQEKRYAL
jgi:hypothetical protein